MSESEYNNIKASIHFDQLEKSDKRITVHQGGTRSGKTYNILLWLITTLLKQEGKVLTIVRETMPSLIISVQKDFFNILKRLNVYREEDYKDQKKEYHLRGNNVVQFRSADDEGKFRGAARDYLFINEANQISLDAFEQLILRTTEKIVLDYNPSDEYHWIYDSVIPRDDCDFYKTTYRDNPFLPKSLVDEIERLKTNSDPQKWRVFGLGERGISQSKVFHDWTIINSFWDIPSREVYYGIDFGFQDPTVLVAVKVWDGGIYVDELLYQSYLTTSDIITFTKNNIHQTYYELYGDNSRPETIQEMKNAGINIAPARKGKDSIKNGINFLKSHNLYVTKRSENILMEFKRYSWKADRDGRLTDETCDEHNHAIDAIRYALNKKSLFKGNTTTALLKLKGLRF